MIKIQGKAKANWTREDSVVIDWSNYIVKYKDDRVVPKFSLPDTILDSWDGKETDIQHVRYDSLAIEITAKESESVFMSYLSSLDEMTIIDFETNSGGTVINQTYVVDLTKSENFQIEVEENIGQTSGAKYTIIFKTNRTIVNKALPVLNTNSITFEGKDALVKISEQPLTDVKIFRLSNNNALFVDSTGIERRQYSSGQWTLLGNKLISATLSNCEAAGLSSTRAAIFDSNGDLGVYDHDGTDWALTGNKLNIATAGNFVSLAKVDTLEIATANDNTNVLEQFIFSAPNWSSSSTQNSLGSINNPYISEWDSVGAHNLIYIDSTNNQVKIYRYTSSWSTTSLNITITGKAAISEISTNNAVLIDQSNTARYINIVGTTLTLLDTIHINTATSPYITQLENNKISLTETSSVDSYEYAEPVYYSDFDILNYNKEVESVIIDFPDGTNRLARTKNKVGYEYLQYLESLDYVDFITRLKTTDTSLIKINDVPIEEYEYESGNIAEGLWRIVLRLITATTQTDFDLNPNGAYSITMNSAAISYDSDYPLVSISEEREPITVEWDDGTIKTMQTLFKIGYEFVYFTTTEQNNIIRDVAKYNDVTINSNVLSEITHTSEEVSLGLWKIIIRGFYTFTSDTLYIFPTSGTSLVITDEVPTAHTFYTDYDVMLFNEGAEKNTIKNQTGINTSTKAITKQVKQAKFFLSETNAFSLKSYCELFKPGWTCTLAGSTVYEIINSNDVEPVKLGVDLYEVNVNCLMATTTN